MTDPELWRRIEEAFASLLEISVSERRDALEAIVDPGLKAEVAALLAAHEALVTTDRDFLDGLDGERAGALLDDPGSPIDADSTIGRYEVLRPLGSGWMSLVYQARDPLLDRSVALKLLPPYLSADPDARRRLKAEARASSRIDHANIATVYEIGEAGDGRLFIAMGWYEGGSLRRRMAEGPMAIETVVELGLQLAAGLSAAHRYGIVHRDIKPENLLVTKDGVLKIVDFGIASVLREGLGTVGLPRGTAAYMSPEQSRGEAVDHRTDLWAAGVVLYEMLAGSRPIGGTGEALIHGLRHDAPKPLGAVRSDVPAWLAAAVARCLEKDPKRRFASADELASALRQGARKELARAGRRPRSSARHRFARGAAMAGVAAVALVLVARSGGREAAAPDVAEAALPGIAVLPFEVRGEGLDVWREGMVDLLSVGLDGAADLRTIDSRTVLARWKELAPPGEADLATALQVARASGARYAILGSVVPAGRGVRVVAEIYEVEEGRRLGQAQAEGGQEEILQVIDRLAIRSLGVVLERDRGLPDIDLASLTSASLPAVKEYLGGEVHLRRGEFRDAVASYERAVEADSTFTLAWLGLALTYGWLEGGTNPRGFEAMERALRSGGLPERMSLVARGFTLDPTSVEPLRLAVRKHPDDARLWYGLGEITFHRPDHALVSAEEALSAFQRAIELDPGFAPYWVHLINLAFHVDPDSARVDSVIRAFERIAHEEGHRRGHRLAHDLAFGGATGRARARETLESSDEETLITAELDLRHPRYQAQIFPVLETQLLRAGPEAEPAALSSLVRHSLWTGRLARALGYLDDPRLAGDPRHAYCRPYAARVRGLPIPDAWLDERLSAAVIDSTGGLWMACIGAWAADRGRWEEHARVVTTLRRLGARTLAAGDSISSRQWNAAAGAIEGYAAWNRGRPAEALRLLTAARAHLGPYTSPAAVPHAWWTGQILLELGRPAEAAKFFRAQWDDPLAHFELARIHEAAGEYDRARAEYEVFLAGWQGADPPLQRRVREAHGALRGLRFRARG